MNVNNFSKEYDVIYDDSYQLEKHFSGDNEITDTYDDFTSNSISNGKLKHDFRILKSKFINNTTTLTNNESLFKAREAELLEQLNTLTVRLKFADSRYNSLLKTCVESNELKSDLANLIGLKRRLMNENANLQTELNSIKRLILNTLTKKEELISSGLILENQDGLNLEEGQMLENKLLTELTTLELAKLWIYKTVCLLNKNFDRAYLTNEKCKSLDSIQKHVNTEKDLKSNFSSALHVPSLSPCAKCLDPASNQNIQLDELCVAEKKLELLTLDKEYYLKQISNLRDQINTMEEKCTTQAQKIFVLEKENCDFKSHLDSLQKTSEPNLCGKLQNEELTQLIQLELSKLQTVDSKPHEKQLEILKNEKDEIWLECKKLKQKLKQNEHLRTEYKQELDVIKFNQGSARTSKDLHELLALREQCTSLTIKYEMEQALRKDCALNVDKLNAKLDASKRVYYELDSKFNQEKAIWELRERDLESKLKNYKHMDLEFGSSWLHNQPLLGGDDQMTSTNVSMIRQINAYKEEVEKLKTDLSKKDDEVKKLEQKLTDMVNWKSLTNQPTEYLAQSVTQKNNEIQTLRSQLDEYEKMQNQLEIERNSLAQERNTLILDLERLLTQRQSFNELRQNVVSLITNMASLSHSTKNT